MGSLRLLSGKTVALSCIVLALALLAVGIAGGIYLMSALKEVEPATAVDKKVAATKIEHDPVIPAGMPAGPFLGAWVDPTTGQVVYVISESADGRARIGLPPNDTWEPVISDVRIEEGKLHFTERYYYIGAEDPFPRELEAELGLPPISEHPFSGKPLRVTLEPVPAEPHRLRTLYRSEDPPQLLKGELIREEQVREHPQ